MHVQQGKPDTDLQAARAGLRSASTAGLLLPASIPPVGRTGIRHHINIWKDAMVRTDTGGQRAAAQETAHLSCGARFGSVDTAADCW